MFKIESIRLKPYQKEIFLFLSLVCIGFAIFYPSFLNQNYFWDDERFVFMNPEVLQAPNWYSFWNFKSEFFKTWPLGYSIFWSLEKYSPVNSLNFYKSLNIVFHGVNAYLLLQVLRSFKFPFPLLLSLIFLIHPLQVETVSWIFQLLTILSFSFFLISFLFLLNFAKTNHFTFLLFSFIFFVFSLWTKSIFLLSPFLFVLIFWVFNTKKMAYFLLIPFFIMSLHVGYINMLGALLVSNQKPNEEKMVGEALVKKMDSNISEVFQAPSGKIENNDKKLYFDFIYQKGKIKDAFNPIRTQIFNQASWHYFSKVLVPFNLQFIYPNVSYHFSLVFISIFSLFLLPVIFCIYYKDKIIALISGMSLVFIAPYLGITTIAFFYWSNVSDRYTYSFILVLVFVLGLLAKRYNNKIFKLGLAIFCSLLAIQNLNYGHKFNQPLRLYKEIVEYKPHPVIYSLLVEQYFLKLDAVKAEQTLNEGLLKFPDDPQLNQDLFKIKAIKQQTYSP